MTHLTTPTPNTAITPEETTPGPEPALDPQLASQVEFDPKTAITVSPFYHSAVNAITKPDKMTHVSQYFIDRWMPLLGGNGTMIVLALRRNGFLNRKTGECRDEIVLDGADLAAATGISEDTLIRELGLDKKTGKPRNEWLHQFVKKRQRRRRTATGALRQLENAYWISMDDPIHPDDWPLVVATVQEAEKRTQKYSGPPDTHFAYPVRPPDTQNAAPDTQNAEKKPQNAVGKPQNAYRLKSLDSSIQKKTLKTAALPGVSPAAFPGKDPAGADEPLDPAIAAKNAVYRSGAAKIKEALEKAKDKAKRQEQ